MTQPYGQQPGNYGQQPGTPPGGYPQAGGYQQPSYQPGGGYPQSGGFPQPGAYQQGAYPQAPGYVQGPGGLPQAPPEYGRGGGPVEKPGTVTGAAVLGYIQAGITLITTGIIFFGLVSTGGTVEGWLIGLAQLAGIVLLIFGSVQLMSGTARTIYVAGAALEILISLYYLVRVLAVDTGGFEIAEDVQGGLAVIAVFFAIMPAIGLILALGSGTSEYLRMRRG